MHTVLCLKKTIAVTIAHICNLLALKKALINRGLAKIYGFWVKNTENQAFFSQFLHFSRVSKSLLRVNFCQKIIRT